MCPLAKPSAIVGKDCCPLKGGRLLAAVDAAEFYHRNRGMRAPLAIYNASLARVCPRIFRYCTDIEPLFHEVRIDPRREGSASRAKVSESLEAMVYAAAEHVDDLEKLASGFFKTHGLAKRDSRYREFSNRIDKYKKLTSTIANKLKHEQARVRLSGMEIRHADIPVSLHGFVIEGVNDGVIGPHSSVHSVCPVLSLTTLAWEVLIFVAEASLALERFLKYFPALEGEHPNWSCEQFNSAVKAAARLPTYTFGEPHPFSRMTLRIDGSAAADGVLDSGLYGSIQRRWSESLDMTFQSFLLTFEGDGVSRSFALVKPSKVSLVHWR